MENCENCHTALVLIDNPAEHFGLNYDYGLDLMFNAAWYLSHTFGDKEQGAIALIMQVSREIPISLDFDLPA